MENLRSAAQAAKLEINGRAAELAQRREQERQEAEAARQAAEQQTKELAHEFLSLMREAEVPQIGQYEEIRERTTTRDKYGLTGMKVTGLIGPSKQGWLAVNEVEVPNPNSEWNITMPSVFIDEEGRTYKADKLRRFGDTEYVTSLSEDPAILGDDGAFERVTHWIGAHYNV